ncbi:MAG: 50S ribosomal protein L35 [Firmicutes bacterium]|nr:50S ribosomal protein L35 [Bacillota bacterium]
MPKMKSHSGAKKRYSVTASGKVKRGKQGHNHILTKKAQKRKVGLRETAYLDSEKQTRTIRVMIQK